MPGVLLLDAVMQAAGLRRGRLLRAKFIAPVLPGDAVEIRLDWRGPTRAGFTCRCRGTIVLTGELTCEPPDPTR